MRKAIQLFMRKASMTTVKKHSAPKLLILLISISLLACEETLELSSGEGNLSGPFPKYGNVMPNQGNLVMVETEHLDFQLPNEILSGWTTFRYLNNSHHTHFFLLEKMPIVDGDQKDLEDYNNEIVPVFDAAMELINQGKLNEGLAEFINLPDWADLREYIGGVSLLGPGEVGQTMQKLEPGLYVLECYVKSDGVFHTSNGMAAEVLVKEEESTAKAPKATLQLDISSNGYELKGNTRPGIHTMEVNFLDQKVYGNFVGHDVNLVRIEDDADIQAVNDWMNWLDIEGLNNHAPATFLGGVEEMPAGSKAYVTFRLKPGRYALVAEVPDPKSKGFFKTFTVASKE